MPPPKWVACQRPRLTYANIASTLALFLALGGGAAYAASKVNTGDLAKGAVHASNVFKRAITSGKLAVGAVRSNQVVDGAIGSKQLADSAVGTNHLTVRTGSNGACTLDSTIDSARFRVLDFG